MPRATLPEYASRRLPDAGSQQDAPVDRPSLTRDVDRIAAWTSLCFLDANPIADGRLARRREEPRTSIVAPGELPCPSYG
jgi:hypothetical protein